MSWYVWKFWRLAWAGVPAKPPPKGVAASIPTRVWDGDGRWHAVGSTGLFVLVAPGEAMTTDVVDSVLRGGRGGRR
jgi:hypothetical protein